MIKIGVIGLGVVGSAIYKSLQDKIVELNNKKYDVIGYDKYKETSYTLNDCLKTNILFLALPTQYNENLKQYDYSSIDEICTYLYNNNYIGSIVIKSTIEPTKISSFELLYSRLHFIHNPEFLKQKTAYEDFHNQTHVILGVANSCNKENIDIVKELYTDLYPSAEISICTSTESECVKIFCNSFYAVKIQFFNELYQVCGKIGCNYDNIVALMLKNGRINPMDTNVPGPDGKLSYGGMCYPKDTNALLEFMKRNDIPHKVLEATIDERNSMRTD